MGILEKFRNLDRLLPVSFGELKFNQYLLLIQPHNIFSNYKGGLVVNKWWGLLTPNISMFTSLIKLRNISKSVQ